MAPGIADGDAHVPARVRKRRETADLLRRRIHRFDIDGNSTTDLSIAYGASLVEPALVLTMSYQLFGTSDACSKLRIAPAAGFAAALCLEGGSCFYETPCRTGGLHGNCPVAAESSTWGRVKALYRD